MVWLYGWLDGWRCRGATQYLMEKHQIDKHVTTFKASVEIFLLIYLVFIHRAEESVSKLNEQTKCFSPLKPFIRLNFLFRSHLSFDQMISKFDPIRFIAQSNKIEL